MFFSFVIGEAMDIICNIIIIKTLFFVIGEAINVIHAVLPIYMYISMLFQFQEVPFLFV